MSKTPWESRVGMLLDPLRDTGFAYSYKPPDYKSGGQPRVDWLACQDTGLFWMIEVKSVPLGRTTISYWHGITAGQRDALDGVAQTIEGFSLLAAGQNDRLYFFDWRAIRWWRKHEAIEQIPLDRAFLALTWAGEKKWSRLRLDRLVENHIPDGPLDFRMTLPQHVEP